MPLQAAIQFIERVRADEILQGRLDQLDRGDLHSLVDIAAELDYAFTVEELRLGFKHDWVLRWLRYRPASLAPVDQG